MQSIRFPTRQGQLTLAGQAGRVSLGASDLQELQVPFTQTPLFPRPNSQWPPSFLGSCSHFSRSAFQLPVPQVVDSQPGWGTHFPSWHVPPLALQGTPFVQGSLFSAQVNSPLSSNARSNWAQPPSASGQILHSPAWQTPG